LLITVGSSLASALIAGSAGLNAFTALDAARNEVQNNYLNHAQMAAFEKEFNQCATTDSRCQQGVWARWKAISDKQDRALGTCVDEYQCDALADQARAGARYDLNLNGATNAVTIERYLNRDNNAAYVLGEMLSHAFASRTVGKRVVGGAFGVAQAGWDAIKGVVTGVVDTAALSASGYGQILNLVSEALVGSTAFDSAKARSEAAANFVANIDKLPAAVKNQINSTLTMADRLEAAGETVKAAQLRSNLVANISSAIVGGANAPRIVRGVGQAGEKLVDTAADAGRYVWDTAKDARTGNLPFVDAARLNKATDELLAAVESGRDIEQHIDKLAGLTTHIEGGENRVVIGIWEGNTKGFIGEAKANGGVWYQTPDTWYRKIEARLGATEGARVTWAVNQRVLQKQLEVGIAERIDFVFGRGETSAMYIDKRIDPETYTRVRAREFRYLLDNGPKHGYFWNESAGAFIRIRSTPRG
jgi:hypothetical protein